MMKTDKDRTPVAQNVITVCSKCGMELAHVVVAHNMNGIIRKVKCNTCGSEHVYRPEKKTVPKKDTGAKKVTSKMLFEELTEKFKEKIRAPYSISGSFKNDDVIVHKTFGKGIVTRTSFDKMEVTFSSGPRILVHNR